MALRLFRTTTIYEYQRGVRYDDGRFRAIVEPGRHWITKRSQVVAVDMRRQLMQVPGQEILTTDSISIKVSAVVDYAIVNAKLSIDLSNNVTLLLYSHAQQALRSAIAALPFEAVLTSRSAIDGRMVELLTPLAAELGVSILSVQVRDIMLPAEIRRAFAAAVTAQKEGLAALERGRGETASLRALANAAKMLADHPGLLQLRALQTLEASKTSHTLKLDLSSPGSVKE